MENLIEQIKQIVKETPNDFELGKKIRELINNEKDKDKK